MGSSCGDPRCRASRRAWGVSATKPRRRSQTDTSLIGSVGWLTPRWTSARISSTCASLLVELARAAIFVGGQTTGFSGSKPGIRDCREPGHQPRGAWRSGSSKHCLRNLLVSAQTEGKESRLGRSLSHSLRSMLRDSESSGHRSCYHRGLDALRRAASQAPHSSPRKRLPPVDWPHKSPKHGSEHRQLSRCNIMKILQVRPMLSGELGGSAFSITALCGQMAA